jgi:hypothetical protein
MDASSEVLTLINFMRLKLSKFDVAAWPTSLGADAAELEQTAQARHGHPVPFQSRW